MTDFPAEDRELLALQFDLTKEPLAKSVALGIRAGRLSFETVCALRAIADARALGEVQIDKAERSQTETIDQRDAAEETISQAYFLIVGHPPEWSNLFGYKEALDEIDAAQRTLREAARKTQMPVVATDEMVEKALDTWYDHTTTKPRGFIWNDQNKTRMTRAIAAYLTIPSAAPDRADRDASVGDTTRETPDVASEGRVTFQSMTVDGVPTEVRYSQRFLAQPDPLLAFADAVCRFADRSCPDAGIIAEIKAARDGLRANKSEKANLP